MIFTPAHFLRHVTMPTLREFTNAHSISKHLKIDWNEAAQTLPIKLHAAVEAVQASLSDGTRDADEITAVQQNLDLWQDDLRRVHLLSNDLASNDFHNSSASDPEVLEAFATRAVQEQALWVFHSRPQLFRDVELRLAFQAKANGKSWKKHRIERGLPLTQEKTNLDAFSLGVADLFIKSGAGKSTHVEKSVCISNGSIQLTIYVEGPITAQASFTKNKFKYISTRIALETAIVYQPATGIVESIIRGGSKNHDAMLHLFGKHVLGREIRPEEIEKTRFKLNELRDGIELFDDLSSLGVEKIRLRRAYFKPRSKKGVVIRIEATAEPGHDDAVELARKTLHFDHLFETEYDIAGVCMLVYMKALEGQKPKQFSFDVYTTGSSTIKNLSVKNQPIANAILSSLNVSDAEESSD